MAQRQQLLVKNRTAKLAAIRRTGEIPAVIYGRGMASVSVQVDAKQFLKVWQQAGSNTLVDLKMDTQTLPALIRDIQMHPLNERIMHVDLYRVRMDQEIEASIPLSFAGVSPAVKDLSGVLVRNIDEMNVKALPQDLPHEIEVDISSLTDFEKVIHIKDLAVPKGVTLLHNPEDVVALVQPPRSEEELEQLTEEVKEDVEAVEGIKKEEPAAEGAAPGAEAEGAGATEAKATKPQTE